MLIEEVVKGSEIVVLYELVVVYVGKIEYCFFIEDGEVILFFDGNGEEVYIKKLVDLLEVDEDLEGFLGVEFKLIGK